MARAVLRSTGEGRRRAEKSNSSGRRKEEDPFRKEAPSSFPIWLFYNSPAFSKASRASDRRPCTSTGGMEVFDSKDILDEVARIAAGEKKAVYKGND